jgi:vancomycin resistance protein VanJ
MRRLPNVLDLLVLAYLEGLVALRVAGWLWDDQFRWLALANAFSVWLFAPAPVLLLLALLFRRRRLPLLGALLPLLLFAALYGPRFLPRPPDAAAAAGPTLVVMTFNTYGLNERPEGVVAVIRATRPDVVAIQELNPLVAAALERDLGAHYPYRALQPRPWFDGIGVISKLPLVEDRGDTVLPSWGNELQQVTLNWHGQRVVLLNGHARRVLVRELEESFRIQEAQTRDLLAHAATLPPPVVIAGDFNRGEDNATAAWMAHAFGDAFLEAGRGLGHTFPMPGEGEGYGMPLGSVLSLRLDYVYHSRDLRAVSAAVGPWDGHSDHLPVLATLARAS